jgi:glutamate-1-semialdehyde 2,1-aminomutase
MNKPKFERKPHTEHELELLEKSKQFLACGIRSPSATPGYDMVIKGGKGSRVFDHSGNEYLDYLLGSGPMFMGHAHPAVVKAVQDQIEQGTGYLLTNEPAIRLSEEIVNIVPCAEKVTYHNSGSEATFYAMRLARAYSKRDKILKFEGGFHGMNDYALMSNQWTFEPVDHPKPVPNSAGIPKHIEEQVLVAPFNDLETTEALIREHADDLGGVIIEPLCRTFPPVPGFLEGLREVTRELDIPLIFDEVVTGFRMALGGAQEYYGVTPDLCAAAKTISGGHPFGLVCGRADIMDFAGPSTMMSDDHVRLTGTYSGNPVSTAVALAIIQELKKPGVYEEVDRKGNRLKNALTEMLAGAGIPATVIGEATAFQPWFSTEEVIDHRSSLTLNWNRHFKLIDLLLDRGILKGHEKFFVSIAHTDEDIDYTIAALADLMDELKAA